MIGFMKRKSGLNSQTSFFDELIVDNFAGGGGASVGMELATSRPVDIAINHVYPIQPCRNPRAAFASFWVPPRSR